jgi:type VI secretion system secreted protein Hcp
LKFIKIFLILFIVLFSIFTAISVNAQTIAPTSNSIVVPSESPSASTLINPNAPTNYFLKVDTIPGESTDAKHKDWIEALSYSLGVSQVDTGKVSFNDFHFVMKSNKATAKLLEACAKGTHIPTVTLSARKAGGGQQDYLIVKFTDVLITSYQTGGSNGDIPLEEVSFNYSKIDYDYKPEKPDGGLGVSEVFGWDLKINKSI